MKGKNAKNLEDTLIKRLNQVDDLNKCKFRKRKKYKNLIPEHAENISENGTCKI